MAGIQTLINQAMGVMNAGNPNPIYYEIGQNEYSTSAGTTGCNANSGTGPASTCSFNDVTLGDNVLPCAGAFNCYLDGEALGVLSTSNTIVSTCLRSDSGMGFCNRNWQCERLQSAKRLREFNSCRQRAGGAGVDITRQWSHQRSASAYFDLECIGRRHILRRLLWRSVSAASRHKHVGHQLCSRHTDCGDRVLLGRRSEEQSGCDRLEHVVFYDELCVSPQSIERVRARAGGTGTIPVTASGGCAWTAVSNVPWILVTTGSSGTGNGTVGYAVAADGGGPRTGTVSVAGPTFTVTQLVYPLISTLAGGAMPSTAAPGISLSIPVSFGVAVDAAGNAYFPSPNLNALFKVDPTGIVTRVAGTGAAGYGGDSGPALSAQLNSPNGVAVDSAGNLYIADTSNPTVSEEWTLPE